MRAAITDRTTAGRRPLRDGLSLREDAGKLDKPDAATSPSFTGRPFIEGNRANTYTGCCRGRSPSFTGRPFIEGPVTLRNRVRLLQGRRPLRDGLSLRGVTETVSRTEDQIRRRRPLRDGLSLRDRFRTRCGCRPLSPSFTGRPFIEGSWLPRRRRRWTAVALSLIHI